MITLSATPTIATQTNVQLDFLVGSDWEGLYDRLEVWRSRDTAEGPYERVTTLGDQPARLPKGAGDPPSPAQVGASINLVGKKLELLVNETVAVEVTFSGTDPLTSQQAAAQVTAQSTGLFSSYVLGPHLVVQTVELGQLASLRVTGGDAAPLLGLPTQEPDNVAFGSYDHLTLIPSQRRYTLVDMQGAPEFFYRARFLNTTTSHVSEFSEVFQGKALRGVSEDAKLLCYVQLCDSAGNPAKNQEILVYTAFSGRTAEGFVLAGNPTVRGLTDVNGRFEVLLLRGAKITVAVGATSLVRDVLIPVDPAIETLNLLDPTVGSNDVFSVQRPVFEFAARRSL